VSDRVSSPCNDVCQLDRASGWCLGCGRTGAEIQAWPRLTEEERERLMAMMPARLEALGLPADPDARRLEGERRARAQRMAQN
jgi:hypothetical protein